MIDLMTLNGIPPTCLVTLRSELQAALLADAKKAEDTHRKELHCVSDSVYNAFEKWGLITYIRNSDQVT